MNSDGRSQDSRKLRWALRAVKALAFLASFWVIGLAISWNNNDLQLPIVQRFADPSLYPGDPYVATVPYYASTLWQSLGPLFRVFPEIPLLLVLTALQRWFCLYAAGRLARALTGGDEVAEAATWCVFAGGMGAFVGMGTVVSSYFEHTSVAVACFLLVVAAFVEGRPRRAGVWFGLMALCNVMHAALAAILLVGTFVTVRDRRKLGASALIAIALASPAIIAAYQSLRITRIDNTTFSSLVWFYFPYHFYPSHWDPLSIALLVGSAAVLVLSGWLPGVGRERRGLALSITAGCAVCLLASVGAEASGRGSLVNCQFARAVDLWTAFSAVYLVSAAASALRKGSDALQVRIASGLLFVAVAFLWRTHFAAGLPAQFWLIGVLVVAMAALGRSFVSRWGALVSPIAFLLLAATLVPKTPPRDSYLFKRPFDEVDAAAWARASTPVDSVFLVNPTWGGFRTLSHRSTFVTWKEGAAILWYPPFAKTWMSRLRAIGVEPMDPMNTFPASIAQLGRKFDGLGDDDALRLANQFGLRYWVIPAEKPTNLPVVHSNETLKVVTLRYSQSAARTVP